MLRSEATVPTNPQAFLDAIRKATTTPNGSPDDAVPLFIFDTETTGLSANDCIVEIGCVEMVKGKLTGRNFHRLCKPFCKMNIHAAKVHGITDDVLKDAIPIDEALMEFIAYLEGTSCDDIIGSKMVVTTNASGVVTGCSIEPLEEQMQKMSIAKVHKEEWANKMKADTPNIRNASSAASSLSSTVNSPSSFSASTPALQAPTFAGDNTSPKEGASANTPPAAVAAATPPALFALCGHNAAFDIRMLTNNSQHFNMHTLEGMAAMVKEMGERKRQANQQNASTFGESKNATINSNLALKPFVNLHPFVPSSAPSVCTMQLMRQLFPGQGSYKLDACCDFFGVDRNLSDAQRTAIGDFRLKASSTQHSALTDAYGTALLLMKMIEAAEKAVSKQ